MAGHLLRPAGAAAIERGIEAMLVLQRHARACVANFDPPLRAARANPDQHAAARGVAQRVLNEVEDHLPQ